MRIKPVEDHVRERAHREYNERRISDGRRKHENRVKGLPVLRQMDNGREYEWGARMYHAPPMRFDVSLDCLEVQQRWDALVRAADKYEKDPADNPPPDVQEWRAVCREVARLFKLVYKPTDWRRFVWFLIPSPARNAPPAGVGRIVGGFSALRTRDAIDSLLAEAASFPTGTSPGASSASSPPTPRSVNGASPGPRFGRNRGKPSSPGST